MIVTKLVMKKLFKTKEVVVLVSMVNKKVDARIAEEVLFVSMVD